MTMASKVSQFLRDQSVDYQLIPHAHSQRSSETARSAHVREDQVAKAILLEDSQGYVLAVIPASASLDMRAIHDETGRRHLQMVQEQQLSRAFPDCELGALPPLGQAYGITTLLDNSLRHLDTVYFEAGDHEELVAMDGTIFARLFEGCQHCDLGKDWP